MDSTCLRDSCLHRGWVSEVWGQLDFDSIGQDVWTDECVREGCAIKVAEPDSLCYGCLAGLLTDEIIQKGGRYLKNPDWKPKKGRRK